MHPNIRLVRLPLGVRYAIQGMVLLAQKQKPGKYCLINEIAAAGNLPKNFLAKIFQDLARAGLVESRRGRGGGFGLAAPPNKIRLMEIIEAINDPVPEQVHCLLKPYECKGDEPCVLHQAVAAWEELMRNRLEQTTLAEAMAGGVRGRLSI